MADAFRFLDPWWLMLPRGGGAVLAVAGAGGKSELLRRLLRHYRSERQRVLWTQTVPHAAAAELSAATVDAGVLEPSTLATLRAALDEQGALFVAGAQRGGIQDGLPPATIETLRAELRPDVVLVEAHAPTATPLRLDGVAPLWPTPVQVAFLVSNLAATGRPFGPRVVAGVTSPERIAGEEPRRVGRDDVLGAFNAPSGLLAHAPLHALVVPFLTGFGSFRDIDGMFALATELWQHPAVRLVCFAELLGDVRRDAADLELMQALPPGRCTLDGERIYAVYPADLDEAEEPQAGEGGASP